MPRYIDVVEVIYDGDRLKAVPAADVEEVRHATWECIDESDNVWECSGKDGCGEHFILYEGTPEDNNYKRCPNCGTRMDGKEKTDERDHTV